MYFSSTLTIPSKACGLFLLLCFIPGLAHGVSSSSSYVLLPDSSWYFLKKIEEKGRLMFAVLVGGEAREYLRVADIRLAEYEKLLEEKKTNLTPQAYEKYLKAKVAAEAKIREIDRAYLIRIKDMFIGLAKEGWFFVCEKGVIIFEYIRSAF